MHSDRKRIVPVVAVIGAFFLSSLPVGAVTVVPTHGDVRVSTEGGFNRLDQPSEVAPFTRVMVAPGGLATIVYTANCQVRVTSYATVLAKTPCKGDFAPPSYMGADTESPPQQATSMVSPPKWVAGQGLVRPRTTVFSTIIRCW